MNYTQSIDFIESLLRHGIKLGLDRVQRLLARLDDPQTKFLSVLIAGTNGKGSTAAMLSSILTKAGYKTGLYTSPHLLAYTERIRINERDISKQSFAAAASKVRKALASVPDLRITEFEFLTAMAFRLFAQAKIDIAVVEVGMGGRFDATNVLTPLCSVITNVELDHTEFLGKSVKKIAFEKAGIIKSGIPVVTAEQKAEALKVFKAAAREKQAPLYLIDNLQLTLRQSSGSTPSLIEGLKIENYCIALKGEHQKINAALALKVVDILKDKGFKVSELAVKGGLKDVRWPGRFEIISQKPLVILDGAHNPAGIEVLVKELKKAKTLPIRQAQGNPEFTEGLKRKKKLIIVLGMQANKDIKGVIKKLSQVADSFILTRSSHPQAASPRHLAAHVKTPYRIIPDFSQAYRAARKGTDMAVICGSLFLVAEAKKIATLPHV